MSGRGLRLGLAVAAVALVAVIALRSCRSEAEKIADSVDAARSALADGKSDEFLAFFAPEVRYRGDRHRKDLEKDLARWIETHISRVDVTELTVDLAAEDALEASVRLRGDVGDVLRTYASVEVTLGLRRESPESQWRVFSFSWK